MGRTYSAQEGEGGVTMPERTLYERLGGVDAIALVVDRFSDQIVTNPKLNVNPVISNTLGLPGQQSDGLGKGLTERCVGFRELRTGEARIP